MRRFSAVADVANEKVGRYARDATRGHKRAIFYCHGRRYIGGFDIGRTWGRGNVRSPSLFPGSLGDATDQAHRGSARRAAAVTGRDRSFIFV